MNDGAVTPIPVVQSLGLGQLNRLWSRDGSIHDVFIGLVSCFDQLGLQVLCVQETQTPHELSSCMYTRFLSNLCFDSELQHVFCPEPGECRDSRVFHVDRVFLRLC